MGATELINRRIRDLEHDLMGKPQEFEIRGRIFGMLFDPQSIDDPKPYAFYIVTDPITAEHAELDRFAFADEIHAIIADIRSYSDEAI